MAVIPQYNAADPAKSRGPVLDPGQRSKSVAGNSNSIGDLARAVSAGFTPLPNVDPNMGQNLFRAVDQVGQSVGGIGDVLFGIRQQEAEARNYADIQAAQVAMDTEAAKFDQWREQNPDPRTWEKEWHDRSKQFYEGYFEGREIAPAAREAIEIRFDSFSQRRAVAVGTAALKATAQQAKEAVFADYQRAIDARDMEAAQALPEYAFNQGWIGEDDAVRMQIQGRDAIEDAINTELDHRAKTAINYGDITSAREFIGKKILPEEEKNHELSILDSQYERRQLIADAKDLIAEDPYSALKTIRSDQFSKLRPHDRGMVEDAAMRAVNFENGQTAALLKQDITRGGFRDPSFYKDRDDYKSLPESWRMDIDKFAVEGASNDIGEFMSYHNKVRSYELSEDPRGIIEAELRRDIALNFDGERETELLTTLEERVDPSAPSLTASDKVKSDIRSWYKGMIDDGLHGAFQFDGGLIKKREDGEGNEYFAAPDENGETFDSWWWGDERKERKIQLSEEQKIRWEAGNRDGFIYEDITAKNAAYSAGFKNLDEFDKRSEGLPVNELQDLMQSLIGANKGARVDKMNKTEPSTGLPGNDHGTISRGLFPSSRFNPYQEMDAALESINTDN